MTEMEAESQDSSRASNLHKFHEWTPVGGVFWELT
jgi:hypothetical protein